VAKAVINPLIAGLDDETSCRNGLLQEQNGVKV